MIGRIFPWVIKASMVVHVAVYLLDYADHRKYVRAQAYRDRQDFLHLLDAPLYDHPK